MREGGRKGGMEGGREGGRERKRYPVTYIPDSGKGQNCINFGILKNAANLIIE